jgi:hypothetical protein
MHFPKQARPSIRTAGQQARVEHRVTPAHAPLPNLCTCPLVPVERGSGNLRGSSFPGLSLHSMSPLDGSSAPGGEGEPAGWERRHHSKLVHL